MNQSYFIKGFPDYRLVRLSESKFCVLSNKKGFWEEIGSEDEAGHIHLHLSENGVKRDTYLHVLVAEMFVPNPENKPIVHHIDEDPTNNDPSDNLMWVTATEHQLLHFNGKHLSDDTKRKIGEANAGRQHTEETRRKMSEAHRGEKAYWYGKHHSEETIKKIREAKLGKYCGKDNPRYGKHHSEETKQKLREANLGKHHSEETRKKMSEKRQKKPVIQYTLGGEFIAEHPSVLDAVRQTGIDHRSISRCCQGTYKSAGGYKWRYVMKRIANYR